VPSSKDDRPKSGLHALTFGEYVEARDPKVVSNSMKPRTEPCIALYPTLNANGSWRLYNLKTKKLVSRSHYIKVKHTPDSIIHIMNTMAEKGHVTSSDINLAEHVDIPTEQANEPPTIVTQVPDPNIVEQLQNEDSDEEPQDVDDAEMEPVAEPLVEPVIEVGELEEEEVETMIPPAPPTRRSTRGAAGKTTKFDDFLSGATFDGFGMALTNLKVKVALERFGKVAYGAIKDELEQLFIKKKALAPTLLRDFTRTSLYFPILRSHMFLREKYNAIGVFEKIKARLVADGSTQDGDDFHDEDISSPTACLESIFNMLKLVAVEKRHLLILDIGGAYLNAKIDKPVYMYIQPDLVNILLNICPEYAKFKDSMGRMLTQIDKAMYGLVQSAKLWYNTISGVLEKDGYAPNPMDPCVWNKTVNGK